MDILRFIWYNTQYMEKQTKQKPKADYKKIYSEIGKKNGADIRQAKADTEQKKIRTFAKPLYTNSLLLAYRIAKYMYSQDNAIQKYASGDRVGKSYTLSGCQAATNFLDSKCWHSYKDGEFDHLIDEQNEGVIIVSRSGVQTIDANTIEGIYLPYILYLMDIDLMDMLPQGTECLSDDALKYFDSRAKDTYFSQILQKYTLLVQSQRESDLYDKGRTSDIFIHKARYGWQDETVVTTKREIVTSQEAQNLLDEYMKSQKYLIE